MKRKTWMISAPTYAMAFMACFRVLYILKVLMEPSGPVSVERRESQVPESAREEEVGEEREEQAGLGLTMGSRAGETQDEVIRQEGYKEWKKRLPGMWDPQDPEEPRVPPKLILATNLHYQSALTGDGGEVFWLSAERCDGKMVQYLSKFLGASPNEVIKERPSALILSGDTTVNGERVNHEELAAKLKRTQDAGIQALVIPGNHDINNHDTAVYYGVRRGPAPYIDGPEFHKIYCEYGYGQALSRGSNLLSYVYALDDRSWFPMLDSCQYELDNKVEGRLRDSTMTWANEQLARTREEGMFVVPIAHCNLLAQSRMYTIQCVMDNNGEVTSLLQKHEPPLFFSGHPRVQHIRKHKGGPGVPEGSYGIRKIVADALSIPSCQYGGTPWEGDGGIPYVTRSADMPAWARNNRSVNPDLLDLEDWSCRYIQKLVSDQIRGVAKNLETDVGYPAVATYVGVYIDYYAGREINVRGIKSIKGYRSWERNMPDSYLIRELDAMIADSDGDNNYFPPPEKGRWLTGDQTGNIDGRFGVKPVDGKPPGTLQQAHTIARKGGLL